MPYRLGPAAPTGAVWEMRLMRFAVRIPAIMPPAIKEVIRRIEDAMAVFSSRLDALRREGEKKTLSYPDRSANVFSKRGEAHAFALATNALLPTGHQQSAESAPPKQGVDEKAKQSSTRQDQPSWRNRDTRLHSVETHFSAAPPAPIIRSRTRRGDD